MRVSLALAPPLLAVLIACAEDGTPPLVPPTTPVASASASATASAPDAGDPVPGPPEPAEIVLAASTCVLRTTGSWHPASIVWLRVVPDSGEYAGVFTAQSVEVIFPKDAPP